jgi:starch phosphorylase
MVALTLLPRGGYFSQRLDADGTQVEEAAVWNVEELLEPVPPTVHVDLSPNRVRLRGHWRSSPPDRCGDVVIQPLVEGGQSTR